MTTVIPPAIEVDHLSTSYRVHLDAGSTWGGIYDLFRRSPETDRIVPALRDISFDVPRGNVLGVIGRNGAGKSTLLRCIAGVLPPEQGTVTVRGRISSLLNIGVGMNGSLTGRENIRLGGLAIGLSESLLADITDDIAEFAQLGEYVDFPVGIYSSGMRARLAFAVVAHLDPEILLIDEALAGGDSKFQEKVGHKMSEICSNGRTIVLVSHGLAALRNMATTAIWMHQGELVEHGDPDEVVNAYMRYARIQSRDGEFDF